jgi:MinD-like ATPase involved in chromosome partitioning or flagellar assembly
MPPSGAESRRRDLVARVTAPVAGGHHQIVVMSLKGGVGKTTTTVALGSTLASLRGDRIIAVDASPDRGTLSDKVTLETAATIRDLLGEREQISHHGDMRAFTSQSSSGLEVLACEPDPTGWVAFGAEDYPAVCQIVRNYYSICLTDCGTGLLHPVMTEVLRLADQIVLASTPAIDSSRSADATLDWLAASGYGDLARDAVLVLCAVRPRSRSTVSLDLLAEHFTARCRAVVAIPYDARLDEGAEFELDQLNGKTAAAFLELAAAVADGFGTPRRAHRGHAQRSRA